MKYLGLGLLVIMITGCEGPKVSESPVVVTTTPTPQATVSPTPYASICNAGATVDCNQLGAIWATGRNATCAADGTFWNVRSCLRSGGTAARIKEMVHPAERDIRWRNAVCSYQGNYDFQVSMPTNPDGSWVINFQGGGFCAFDGSGQGGCSDREGNLMKAGSQADRSITNDVGTIEPDFSRSTWVYLHYCSNDQYSGTNTTGVMMHYPGATGPLVPIKFTGKYNVRAVMDILRERYGLDDSTSNLAVYAIGHSAGGWGLTNNAYVLKQYLPMTANRGNLMLATHSGFVPFSWSNPQYPVFGMPGLDMTGAFGLLTATWKSELMPACVATNPQTPQKCMSGVEIYPYITGSAANGGMDIPLLVFQNRQDQLYMSLASILPSLEAGLSAADQAARNDFVAQMNTGFGINPSVPNQSSKIKWLMAPSDPMVVYINGTMEDNVHPPLEYTTNPPDGPTNSLDSMTSRFWATRGQGVGRGQRAGEVHTYDCNWVPNHLCP